MITVIAVGRLKRSEYSSLTDEYLKRINRFMKTSLVEVPDRDCDGEGKAAVEAEGRSILEKIPRKAYIISCTPEGETMDSVSFAGRLSRILSTSSSDICFIIGGSAGLSDAVKERSDMLLSFSSFTFAHNLFRVILTEQIYRAFKIINNESYHK